LGTPDGEDGGNGTDLTATLSGPPGVTLGPVPPPPVEPPLDVTAATPPGPRRVSSTVLSGKAIHRVEPRYPPIAVQLGVKGTVIVEVLVDEQGRVISTRVISGPLVLRDCSVRAAERWRFTPTTLNETPVKVIGTIAFNFRHG
jgi:protein TonB